MRSFIFIISLIITCSLLWLMNQPIPNGTNSIPPIGKLINPFTGFWQNTTDSDLSSDALRLPGLVDEVKVVYDDRLVPHIFAQNDLDLCFAQGYITAQHRLWQMDMITRKTSGRLSEVLGQKTLNMDRLQRRKGIGWAAENTLKAWKKSEEEYPKLQAYVKGVNSYINALEPKDYPVEFKILDYEPETWSELKTALVIKSMAETLCAREYDIETTNALAIFGRKDFDLIYPEYNPKDSPIIPETVKWDFKSPLDSAAAVTPLSSAPRSRLYPVQPKGIGSNNWAVSGKKTKSGKPILCNDPHLQLTLPSIWFEAQLHSPDQNIYGVSLPGVPGIIIGFNENISWAVTNVGHDVLDWYKIDWTDANKNSYFLDNKILDVHPVIETIEVKNIGTVYDTVKYTVWGPVVYESDDPDQQDLAMKWLAHLEPDKDELSTFGNLAKAKNYTDYYNALQSYTAPPQNMAFASNEGDIALRVQGRFPLKRKEQGRFIQDGNTLANNWAGFIPKDHNPIVKNPERGFVASANQNSTNKTYPYYYNGHFEDFRGRILNRILDKMDNITPEDMMALQNNNFSIKAEEALPLLLKYIDEKSLDETDLVYYQHLKKWNYKYEANSISPILFEEWFQAFYINTWDEIYTANKQMDVLLPEEWRTIALLEDEPDNRFFDKAGTPSVETAREIVRASFKDMSNAVQNMEIDQQKLEWHQYRNASISHLSGLPCFSRSHINSGGCADALNATRGSKTSLKGYGPSWRMIVALGDEVKAYGIYPGGQSGDPASRFYDNMIDDWAEGNYYELNYLKSADELDSEALCIKSYSPN